MRSLCSSSQCSHLTDVKINGDTFFSPRGGVNARKASMGSFFSVKNVCFGHNIQSFYLFCLYLTSGRWTSPYCKIYSLLPTLTTATLPPCLLRSPRVFLSLPGSRLRFFIAMQARRSCYTLSTNNKKVIIERVLPTSCSHLFGYGNQQKRNYPVLMHPRQREGQEF